MPRKNKPLTDAQARAQAEAAERGSGNGNLRSKVSKRIQGSTLPGQGSKAIQVPKAIQDLGEAERRAPKSPAKPGGMRLTDPSQPKPKPVATAEYAAQAKRGVLPGQGSKAIQVPKAIQDLGEAERRLNPNIIMPGGKRAGDLAAKIHQANVVSNAKMPRGIPVPKKPLRPVFKEVSAIGEKDLARLKPKPPAAGGAITNKPLPNINRGAPGVVKSSGQTISTGRELAKATRDAYTPKHIPIEKPSPFKGDIVKFDPDMNLPKRTGKVINPLQKYKGKIRANKLRDAYKGSASAAAKADGVGTSFGAKVKNFVKPAGKALNPMTDLRKIAKIGPEIGQAASKIGKVYRAVKAPFKAVGLLAKAGSKVLGPVGTAINLYDTGSAIKQGIKAVSGKSHLEKTAKGALKYGVVTERPQWGSAVGRSLTEDEHSLLGGAKRLITGREQSDLIRVGENKALKSKFQAGQKRRIADMRKRKVIK